MAPFSLEPWFCRGDLVKRAVLCALMWWPCAAALAGAPPGMMLPVPVEVGKAVRGPIRSVLPTVGTIRALREIKIGSKIADRVEKVLVDEGDPVKEGQVLCQLDTTDTKLRTQETDAQLAMAEASLAKLEAGLRPNEIKQAEAALEEQEAKVAKLKQDGERARQLFAKGVISDADRDAIAADYATAVARTHAAAAALALAREGSRAEDIAQARATVALRKTELAVARQRLTDATILSPVTGYVVRKHVEVGEWTQIGGTVVEMIDTSILRVHARVTEKMIGAIKEGQKAIIKLDAHADRSFEGTVYRIIPQADEATRSFPVQVNVSDADGVLRAGMFARVSFVLGQRDKVLMVPEDALVYRGGLTLLYRAMPMPAPPPGAAPPSGGGPPPSPLGRGQGEGASPPGGMPPMPGPIFLASRVVVNTGASQDGKLEIREVVSGALDEGDLIVVTGSENLRDGQPIIVVRGLPSQPAPSATPARTGAPPASEAAHESH